MLKTVLITLSSILFATTAVAQGAHEGTYACQYVDATGFIDSGGQWDRANFTQRPPFFIKLGPDTLDPQSIVDGLYLASSYERTTCFPENYSGGYACASGAGETVMFNPVKSDGARASILDAGRGDVEYRGTLSIYTFVCQKV